MRQLITVILLLTASQLACKKTSAPIATETNVSSIVKETKMPREITIWLGEKGEDFYRRYPLWTKIDRQPVGVDFYEINLDQRPRGTTTFKHGMHSFVVHESLGVSTLEDRDDPEHAGFTQYSIYAGITESELIPHDEARIKIYALLKDLMGKGWQRYIDESEPRLKGKSRYDYAINVDSLYGLDLIYLPTLEEWMAIESRTPWLFYADGVYLKVTFTRERTLTDPTKPGAYLLTFDLVSASENAKRYVKAEDREQYKQLGPIEFAKYPAYRKEAESTLRAKGIEIDESYQDPPPPSFK